MALTNAGYSIEYTERTTNLQHSLAVLGLASNLVLFCLQKGCQDKFASVHIDSLLFGQDEGNFESAFLTTHTSSEFAKVCSAKLKTVYLCLRLGYNVIFTDGDVVWLKNPAESLRSAVQQKDYDAVFMCDSETEEQEPRINSGFYFMKSNPKTLQLFAPSRVQSIYTLQESGHEKRIIGDQNYLKSNMALDNVRYKTLPLRLFPNGHYFLHNLAETKKEAHVIHFTHLKGDEKKATMKNHGSCTPDAGGNPPDPADAENGGYTTST